jgi:hypothetical protein
MEHPIIKTENYLLIVDESDIKKCTYCYDETNKRLFFYEGPLRYNYKKVVAHLPLNNSPILEGVDLLPEIDREKYRFTEEDMIALATECLSVDGSIDGPAKAFKWIKERRLPIAFKREELYYNSIGVTFSSPMFQETKTPSGHTQWVGEYIFNK